LSLQIPSHFKFQTRSDLTVPSKALENALVVNREYGGIGAKPVNWVLDEIFLHIFINCNLINTFSQLIWNFGVGLSEAGKSWELDLSLVILPTLPKL
jgi:hypothetical protein